MRRLLDKYQRVRDNFWRAMAYGVGALLVLWGASTILVTAKEGPQKGLEFALAAPGYAFDATVSTAEAGYKKGKKGYKKAKKKVRDWCKPRKPKPPKKPPRKPPEKAEPRERDNDRDVCTYCGDRGYYYQGVCYRKGFAPRPQYAFVPKWCRHEQRYTPIPNVGYGLG